MISQFKKNIVSSFFAFGLNAVILLVTYPIYIKFIGYELLGLWATFTIIITLGEAGNLGISETMMKFLAQVNVGNDTKRIKEHLSSGLLIVFLSGFVLMILILVFRPYIIELLKIPEVYTKLSIEILLYVGIISCTQILLSYLRGVLAGMQRIDLSNYLHVGTNFIKVVLMVLFLSLSANLYSIVWAYIITNSISIILYFLIIRKRFSLSYFSPFNINRIVLIDLVRFGGNISGGKLFSIIFIPFAKGFTARYIGLTEVGYFEIAWKMIYHIRNLMQKGLIAFLPKISELYEKGSYKEIFSLVRRSLKYSLLFSIGLAFVIFFFGKIILILWLGEEVNNEILSGIKILVVGSAISLLFVPHYYTLLGMGKSRVILFEGMIKTLSNIVLLLIFMTYYMPISLWMVYLSVALSIGLASLYVGFSYRNEKIKLTHDKL